MVWNPLSLNWLGLLKNRTALHLPGVAPPFAMMVKCPSTVWTDLIRSFMIRLICSGDLSPGASGGGRGLVEGALQHNKRDSEQTIRSARMAKSFKALISSP